MDFSPRSYTTFKQYLKFIKQLKNPKNPLGVRTFNFLASKFCLVANIKAKITYISKLHIIAKLFNKIMVLQPIQSSSTLKHRTENICRGVRLLYCFNNLMQISLVQTIKATNRSVARTMIGKHIKFIKISSFLC